MDIYIKKCGWKWRYQMMIKLSQTCSKCPNYLRATAIYERIRHTQTHTHKRAKTKKKKMQRWNLRNLTVFKWKQLQIFKQISRKQFEDKTWKMAERDKEWEFHLRSLSSSARDSNYATDSASDPSLLNSVNFSPHLYSYFCFYSFY